METTNAAPDQSAVITAAGAAGSWQFEPSGSTIGFGVKNFWGLATVRGVFTDASGTVEVGDDGKVSARLDVVAASVDTGQAKRDRHLRSKDFFDVEQFPQLQVRVEQLVLTRPDRGTARGRITILGQSRPAEFDVEVTGAAGGLAEVVTSLSIDRSAFGMTWRPMKMASHTVAIDARLRFRKVS